MPAPGVDQGGQGMTIFRKTLIILGATTACLLLVLYLSSRFILLDSFTDIEQREAVANAQRATNMIADDVSSLAEAAKGWGHFDDTFAFLETGDPRYIDVHLDDKETWSGNGVNAMVFVDSSGKVVYKKAFDLESMEFVEPPAELVDQAVHNRNLSEHPEFDCALSGIIMLPRGPMMVTSVPVNASGSPETSAGNLIWGRYLDAAGISRIEQITLARISLENIDSSNHSPATAAAMGQLDAAGDGAILAEPVDDETYGSYVLIGDMDGEPALIMSVETPRDISRQGQESMLYMSVVIVAVGLVAGAALLLMLHRKVIGRMQVISDGVRGSASTGDISLRLDAEGDDELATLSEDINQLMAALESSQQRMSQVNVELEEMVDEKTESLRQKIEVMQALADIDKEIIAADDSTAIQTLICQRTSELLHLPKVMVIQRSADGVGRVTASFGLENEKTDSDELRDLFQTKLLRELNRSNDSLATFNEVTAYDTYLPQLIARENAHSLAVASLSLEGRQLGAMIVFDVVPRVWERDETQVLGLLAHQMALGINTVRLYEEEKTTRQELGSLYRLSRELSDTAPDVDSILSIVARTAVETVNITFCRIGLLNGDELFMRSAYPRRVLGQDLKVGYSEPASSLTYCMRVMKQNMPVVLAADRQVLSCHERDVVFLGGAKTVCLVPLASSNKPLGMMILGEARGEDREPFTAGKLKLAGNIGDQAASALRRAQLFSELENAYMQTVLSLANAVDARDSYTNGHGQVMAHMALAVGRMYNMSPVELESLHYASLLHDVGKIGVSDTILQKPAALTEEEWIKMRKHPSTGEEILSPLPYLEGASLLVRHHHEHYDGSGYPDRLAGDAIPLGARILAVVDSYCAMRDKRAYKEPIDHEQAISELLHCSGTQFDPRVVKTFIRLMDSGIINIEGQLGRRLDRETPGGTEAA